MSTFLQLCQDVARRSGTVSDTGGARPTTVVGQTGRLGKIVSWVQDAWTEIQNSENAWQWMQQEWSGNLIASTSTYTAASFNITDLAEWVVGDKAIWLYDTDVGLSDENHLDQISHHVWTAYYGRGSQTNNRPIAYAVTPANELAFGPIPDDGYAVRGWYRQTVQTLSDNADTPNCPARHHNVILYRTLMLLHEHDENYNGMAIAERNFGTAMSALRRDQLPPPEIEANPIA